MKKTLVAYFSASGTTRKVAEMIAEAGDCALYEITPKELYTNVILLSWDFRSGGMWHLPL